MVIGTPVKFSVQSTSTCTFFLVTSIGETVVITLLALKSPNEIFDAVYGHDLLMEARFVTGSNFTWQATSKKLTKIRLYNQKEFILAKIEEAQTRRKKYPNSMQPNIKESVGGLRDSNLIFWVAQTIYGITNLKDLTQILFSDEEYRDYRAALELLFRVRSALHLITNKQEDRLLLEHIPEVSRLLGFANQKKMVSKYIK